MFCFVKWCRTKTPTAECHENQRDYGLQEVPKHPLLPVSMEEVNVEVRQDQQIPETVNWAVQLTQIESTGRGKANSISIGG